MCGCAADRDCVRTVSSHSHPVMRNIIDRYSNGSRQYNRPPDFLTDADLFLFFMSDIFSINNLFYNIII